MACTGGQQLGHLLVGRVLLELERLEVLVQLLVIALEPAHLGHQRLHAPHQSGQQFARATAIAIVVIIIFFFCFTTTVIDLTITLGERRLMTMLILKMVMMTTMRVAVA